MAPVESNRQPLCCGSAAFRKAEPWLKAAFLILKPGKIQQAVVTQQGGHLFQHILHKQ